MNKKEIERGLDPSQADRCSKPLDGRDQGGTSSVASLLFQVPMGKAIGDLFNSIEADGIKEVAGELEKLVHLAGVKVEMRIANGKTSRIEAFTVSQTSLWVNNQDSEEFISFVAPLLKAPESLLRALSSLRTAAREAGLHWSAAEPMIVEQLRSLTARKKLKPPVNVKLTSIYKRSPEVSERILKLLELMTEKKSTKVKVVEVLAYWDRERAPIPEEWRTDQIGSWESALRYRKYRNRIHRMISGYRKLLTG